MLGISGAGRKLYPSGIAHSGKLSLPSPVIAQSGESTIEDATGKSPTTSTPCQGRAVICLGNSLHPARARAKRRVSGLLLRALADTSLTSLLPLTLQQRLCPGPNRAAQFLATTSPKHSNPQSHQTCLLQSHPIATLQTPPTGGGCPQLAFQNATIPLKKPRSLNLSLCQLAVRVRSLLGNRQQQQQPVGREPQAPLRKALPNASLSPPGRRRTKSI